MGDFRGLYNLEKTEETQDNDFLICKKLLPRIMEESVLQLYDEFWQEKFRLNIRKKCPVVKLVKLCDTLLNYSIMQHSVHAWV